MRRVPGHAHSFALDSIQRPEWSSTLRVAVAPEDPSAAADPTMPAVVGRYTVEKRAIVFKSEYGFDAGRRYVVTFDASKLPAASDAWQPAPLTSIVGLPARNLVPTTVVSGVFPSAQIVSGEERWQFVPAEPWRSGEHRLIVLTFLEDMRAAVSAAPSKSMSFRMWTNRRKRKP